MKCIVFTRGPLVWVFASAPPLSRLDDYLIVGTLLYTYNARNNLQCLRFNRESAKVYGTKIDPSIYIVGALST